MTLTAGIDARQRIVSLNQRGADLVPMIESEWEAAQTAMASTNAELSIPLDILLAEVEQALHRRPLRERTVTDRSSNTSDSKRSITNLPADRTIHVR